MNSSDVKKWYYILPVVSIGAFFVVWVLLASGGDSMIPTPYETLMRFLDICVNPISQATLPIHIWASLKRVLIAFFFAIILGVFLGVGLGWDRFLKS